MKISKKFMEEVKYLSSEEMKRLNSEYDIAPRQQLKLQIDAIVMAAIIGYHGALRYELKKHGIDIGEFTLEEDSSD